MKRKLLAIAGYIAASLAIPLAGLVVGVGFALVVATYIVIMGLAEGDLTPGRLSLAMLPLYYGALGIVWAVPSTPGVILALPFVVAGEVKGIRTVVYYGTVGGLAAALGYVIAAHVLGYAQAGSVSGGLLVMLAVYGLITGAIYWRFVGRNAGSQTAASA